MEKYQTKNSSPQTLKTFSYKKQQQKIVTTFRQSLNSSRRTFKTLTYQKNKSTNTQKLLPTDL